MFYGVSGRTLGLCRDSDKYGRYDPTVSIGEGRKYVAAVGSEQQRFDTCHRGNFEFAIKMRKQHTAARWLPFQTIAELRCVDAYEQQIALSHKMF